MIPDDAVLAKQESAREIARLRERNASLTSQLVEELVTTQRQTRQINDLCHKADQYDSVVAALHVADGGAYRNDTVESVVAAARDRTRLDKLERLMANENVFRITLPPLWSQGAKVEIKEHGGTSDYYGKDLRAAIDAIEENK